MAEVAERPAFCQQGRAQEPEGKRWHQNPAEHGPAGIRIAEFGKAHQPFTRGEQQEEPEADDMEAAKQFRRNPALLPAQRAQVPNQRQRPEIGAKMGGRQEA